MYESHPKISRPLTGWILPGRVHSFSERGGRLVRFEHTMAKPRLYPLECRDGVNNGQTEEAGDAEENVEESKEKVQELETILVEHWEYNTKPDGGQAPTLKVQVKPTEKGMEGPYGYTHTTTTMVQALYHGTRGQTISSDKCPRR